MNKKLTIIAIAVMALMLGGIVWALTRLYHKDSPGQAAASTDYPLLRAIPADAAAVFCFDGTAKARQVLADSTGLLRAFLAPESPALMDYLSRAGASRMAVSLHNSGSLIPLIASECPQADSTSLASFEELAGKAGLKTAVQDGLLLASTSETLLNASLRHLDEGLCILESPGLPELTASIGGAAVAFLSSRQMPKLLQVWSTGHVRQHTDFARNLADWTAFDLSVADDKHVVLAGTSACEEKSKSFLTAFKSYKMPAASFADVLPYFTDYAVSIPIGDLDGYLERYRDFLDAKGRLKAYDNVLKERAGRDMAPGQWARHFQLKEVVRASYQQDGIRADILLVKTGRDIPSGSNPYRGNLAALFGSLFQVTDTVCVSLPGNWTVLGSMPAVSPFSDVKFLDYPLKERLADADLSVPDGIVAYGSVSDCPSLMDNLFAKAPAAALKTYVKGSAYAPALVGIDLSGTTPSFKVSLDKRALKGNKVQVLERDTEVEIPTGPFPVQNSQTGQTNYLYQNAKLSICLNDENGKGVWGVPFKQPICGYVESVDYYDNGKIQFLFAAGSSLYLIDRLGRFVGGFPKDLGKPVLLGPKLIDFTGERAFRVMVLHKDNSLELYNLHGEKHQDWKGIQAPETVKSLPDLLEVDGRLYWVVRTSVRTLVYRFEGGEMLTKEEGSKMIRPDSQVTPNARGGITVDCYDGKTRDIKLTSKKQNTDR